MAAHLHAIKVRYGESDQMGIAHHGAYVTWFEECRIEMMRSLGVSEVATNAAPNTAALDSR